jgi:alkaline phosphatase D
MLRRRSVLSGVLLPLVPACQAPSGAAPEAPDEVAGADAAAPRADGPRAGDGVGPDAARTDAGADARDRTDSRAAEDAPAAPDQAAEPPPPDAAAAEASDAGDQSPAIERIAFGSCNHLEMSQAFWPHIIEQKPQLFLFLGDAIYVDHGNTYAQLAAIAGFKQLVAMARPFVIWDDHDYGGNDTDASYSGKLGAKQRFFDFWAAHGALMPDSPRWTRTGNYDATVIGPPGKEIQLLMLDNRYFKGNPPAGTVLGAEQWTWLDEELRKPARLRIIMSGMELISTSTTPEGWGQFKPEQQHLYDILKATAAKGVLILSGDKHYCEVSRRDDLGLGYPLYDFTSSPMSAPPELLEPNKYRDGADASISDYNFGLITIDWSAADPTVHVQLLHSMKGTVLLERRLTLGQLGA